MSYKYNPYRDTFTHIDDEEPITAWGTGTTPAWGTGTAPNVSAVLVQSYPVGYLADECIERIAEAVVRKMGEEKRMKLNREIAPMVADELRRYMPDLVEEKDYLTADEVKERLAKFADKEVLCSQTKLMNAIYNTPKEEQSWSGAWWLVNHAPIVDAVEVVRCGECKHRDPEDRKCDCGHDILWQLPRDDNWFCADGERRDDER